MTCLLSSSLYNPIHYDIDVKIQIYPNITKFLILNSTSFYNTTLDGLNYNIQYTFTDNRLVKYKKAPLMRCLFVMVYWRVVWN